VSRWSLDTVRIGLAPHQVDFARMGGALGRRPQRRLVAACTPRPAEPPWQAALEAVDAAIAEVASRGDAITVVLSNHWVRYLVLPWQPGVASTAELQQFARLRFQQVYGALAEPWTVRVAESGYGAAQVACAVDGALIAALLGGLAKHGLRLASLQPLLMAAYNGSRRKLGSDAALAIVEPAHVCLGLLRHGRWLDIASRRAAADAADAAEAIEQELATRDADGPPASLDVLLVGEATRWSPAAERPTRWLGATDAGIALALCGVA
jgi:hypothetical protein